MNDFLELRPGLREEIRDNMKVIFVSSPYSGTPGQVKKNVEKAEQYCALIIEDGHIPVAPHIYLTKFLDDNNPFQRERGLNMSLKLLEKCDELWVFGHLVTEGMHQELRLATHLKIKTQKKLYPMEPVTEKFYYGRDDSWYEMPMCPVCGEGTDGMNFCPFCGQWILCGE